MEEGIASQTQARRLLDYLGPSSVAIHLAQLRVPCHPGATGLVGGSSSGWSGVPQAPTHLLGVRAHVAVVRPFERRGLA